MSAPEDARESLTRGVALDTGAGEPLTLRRLTVADAEPFAEHIAGDLPRMSTYLSWPDRTATSAGAGPWIDRYEKGHDGRVLAAGVWAGQRLVAGAVLFGYDAANATVELGCWTTTGFEGQGVASACCSMVIAVARRVLLAERVEWHSTPANVRSRRLAERLGFHYEGTLRSNYLLRGERIDTDVLSLIGHELDGFTYED